MHKPWQNLVRTSWNTFASCGLSATIFREMYLHRGIRGINTVESSFVLQNARRNEVLMMPTALNCLRRTNSTFRTYVSGYLIHKQGCTMYRKTRTMQSNSHLHRGTRTSRSCRRRCPKAAPARPAPEASSHNDGRTLIDS